MARTKKITHKEIESLKPKKSQYTFLINTGLQVLVRPNGSKLWQHRYSINGKRKILSYGVFPDVSLADANELHFNNRKLIASGIDPIEQKKRLEKEKLNKLKEMELQKLREIQEEESKSKYTFKKMALEWHDIQSPDWSPKHRKEVLSSLNRFMFPKLGNKPMINISRHDLMELFKGIEQRPNPPLTALRKLRQRVERVFWYFIDTYKTLDTNPASSIIAKTSFKKPHKVENLRALDKEDVPELLTAIDDYNGYITTKLALKMIVYTFVRHGELRFAKWTEVDWKNRVWIIPKERMKKGKSLVVPLSNQVIEILKQLQTINSDFDFIFASHHKPDKQPISENAIILMLKNIGFWPKTTVHGFRSLFSTIANFEQLNPDWIEQQLAHSTGNKVRTAYNRSENLPQRTIMMQWYANYIDGNKANFEEYFRNYNKLEKTKLIKFS